MLIDQLHYISQPPENGTHLTAIEQVLQAGGQWIQLRVKEQPEDVVLELAIQASLLCEKYGAKLIVNDYPELALKSGAYGVHLGLNDMPVAQARAILGKDKCIGGTANTFADICRRVEEGADYIGLGPFRFTTTKQNLSPVLGLEGYQKLMEQVREAGIQLPIIAIGGITTQDIRSILQTGIYGVAVSGLLTQGVDLAGNVSLIYQKLNLNSKQTIC
ncbi:thiamine-phosphate pyrophosphorylase [Pedobacter cryoconitis]|uniref:Thiamine-phosphate synthase n=1 Tax=Pedobacter cryoconitis TaxID=188932 RepID=A0A7W8YTA2_9SPHI|nr:thiamine phosphate synthase [Pedobacter cryoconitis]MBB5621406.1 thiamine-phosphate pyrophosphorylase [Pedobacter cryoconitis]MBB5643741.1 thiamine-phosphate pyrophosphorylase [Pedobacter cryoconitis]